MFPRFSIVAAFFSAALPGISTQTTNADWYKVEIRSQKQTELKAAEEETSQLKVPQKILFDDAQQTSSGKSKPFTFGVENSGNLWQSLDDSENVPEAEPEAEPRVIHTEQSELVTTIVREKTTAIDENIAADVERLLNQDENWYMPTQGASTDLQSRSFTESSGVVESMNYLDELRELGEVRSPWIQSSVVPAEQESPHEVDFNNDSRSPDTRKVFIDDLEKMAYENLNSSNDDLDGFAPPFMEDLEELFSNRQLPVQSVSTKKIALDGFAPPFMQDLEDLYFNRQLPLRSVSTQMIAQNEPSENYSPSSTKKNDISAEQMNSLFPSVSEISIAGKSTAPPKKSDIKQPENRAPEYMDNLIPAQYTMAPIFGVAAPSRYPHCFTHGALYFEDPNLERCGISHGCFTNARSATLFVCRTLAMPCLVLKTPPRTCMASLGDCTRCAEFGTDAYFREW